MFIESYRVEVQQLATQEWISDSTFTTDYEWRQTWRTLLGIPWLLRPRPSIVGDPHIVAVTVKAEAHKRARHLAIARRPRSVRIVRTERHGSRIQEFVIWQDGRWFEV